MVPYRRNHIAGGMYFFTVTIRDRKSTLLTKHIGLLRETVQRTKIVKPFAIDAWVVLLEHMHAIRHYRPVTPIIRKRPALPSILLAV